MATLTLHQAPPSVIPSDADLLETTASLLAAIPGRYLTQPLSDMFAYVCSIAAPEGRSRAAQLQTELVEYLQDGMALCAGAEYLHDGLTVRADDVSPPGLDDWAAMVALPIVRARVAGCARCQRAGCDHCQRFGGRCRRAGGGM